METEQQQGYDSYTQQLIQERADYNALQIRLDTSPLLDKVEMFLRRQKYVLETDKKSGKQYTSVVQYAEPLANEEGINSILQTVQSLINQHMAMGNYTETMYREHVWMIRTDLAMNTMTCLYDWGIDDKYYHYIIDNVMNMVKLFLSRPLHDGERKALGNSIQTREVLTQQQQNKSIGGLFKI